MVQQEAKPSLHAIRSAAVEPFCRLSKASSAGGRQPHPYAPAVQVDMVLSGHVHAYQRTCELVVWCFCLDLYAKPWLLKCAVGVCHTLSMAAAWHSCQASLAYCCVLQSCATPFSAWLLQKCVYHLVLLRLWNCMSGMLYFGFKCQSSLLSSLSSSGSSSSSPNL